MTVRRALFLIAPLLLLLAGCSLPKIIVLHDPLSAEEHLRLGSIYETQGKADLARDQYRMATEQDPKSTRAWTLLGDLSYQLSDLRQAEKAYGKALDLDPQNGDLNNNLAWVYAQQDRKLDIARALVNRAMELAPDHRPYYLDTLGVIRTKQGNLDEAIAALEESVSLIPAEQRVLLAEAYRHLADALSAAGRTEQADAAREQYQRLTQVPAREHSPEPQ